jgi:putative hydrolases of HD superfamily
MATNRISGALEFLREAERLKSTLRSGYTSTGRPESTAEHTWRLCLMALVFADEFETIDLLRLLKLCIVHDLGEALSGDIPAVMQTERFNKSAHERADLHVLTQALDPAKRAEILALWEEYEAAASPEAILAKGLDKLETILQHNQGQNPEDFDYAFNLGYGQKQTSAHPVLARIRAILDKETRARAEVSKGQRLNGERMR